MTTCVGLHHFSVCMGIKWHVSLTAAGLIVVVEGKMGRAAADKAADRDGQAEVGAVAVGGGAGVPAALPG